MSSALDLVVLNGPLEGEVVQLKPNAPLLLGRSAKGMQLIDPLVSLNHAEITWQGDRYWIEDLESATGTFVNDVRLSDKAVVLVPGMRIRMGETDIEVRERPRSAVLRIVGAAAALFILFLGVKSFMASIEIEYDPAIRWYEPIRQGAGYTSSVLRIPTDFIRETGVDHRELRIEQVSDYDGNGVDELWLDWPNGRRVVTFNPDGTWRTIAEPAKDCRVKNRTLGEGLPAECYVDPNRVRTEVPEACKAFDNGQTFPDLDCTGTTYRFDGSAYVIAEHEGVYTWMPPTKIVAKKVGKATVEEKQVVDGPPEPFLFTLVKGSQFAGFLAERGVVEPVHYLVCEDALPGIRAQVLTEAGEIVPLSVGCIGDIEVEGPTRQAEFGNGQPMIFALTGVGYEALMADVKVYMSGGSDTLFMTQGQRDFYASISRPPQRRKGAIRLSFQGPERIFDPVAHEQPIPGKHALQASEFARQPPPTANTIVIDGPGRYDLDGCSELEVTMRDWHCKFTKGCTASTRFMTVRNIGCGDGGALDVPYQRGVSPYRDPHIEGRVAVESIDQNGQIDVLRVRFAYRRVDE